MTMKQYLIVFLTALLAVACTKDDGRDGITQQEDTPYNNQNGVENQGTYEADWVIDQKVVDHTWISIQGGMVISHFPNAYLLPWVKDTIADVRNSLAYGATWSWAGSASNKYYNSESNINNYYVQIGENKIPYEVKLTCVTGWPTAIYDQRNDQWTVTWRISEVSIQNMVSAMVDYDTWTFTPELTMMLVTTKRIK